MKKRAGFTIVELLVAIAITGIVAGTAAPTIVNYLNSRGPATAANQVYMDLHRYRTKSITRRLNATATFSQLPDQYLNTYDDPATPLIIPDITLPAVLFASFRGQVMLADPGPDGVAANFNFGFTPQGTSPAGSAGTVFITNQGNSAWYRVRSTLAGGISIHVWNAATNTWVSI